MGKRLLHNRIIHHVTYSEDFKDEYLFYRFQADHGTSVLNMNIIYSGSSRKAADIAQDLRKQILVLYNDFLSPDGNHVDYKGMGASEAFQRYVAATAQLQTTDISDMTREEKTAFFVNIYNALVIHADIVIGHPNTSFQRQSFFNNTSYNIGGLDYSLQDIENGILRGNRKPPYAFKRRLSMVFVLSRKKA
jgi:hypothetical protein